VLRTQPSLTQLGAQHHGLHVPTHVTGQCHQLTSTTLQLKVHPSRDQSMSNSAMVCQMGSVELRIKLMLIDKTPCTGRYCGLSHQPQLSPMARACKQEKEHQHVLFHPGQVSYEPFPAADPYPGNPSQQTPCLSSREENKPFTQHIPE